MFRCPTCGRPLAIATDEPVDEAQVATPEAFMRLGYRLSSTARWSCPDHGDAGRVTVAVIGDHVEFVAPEPELEA